MNLAQAFKDRAERAMGLHDQMPEEWRELANEYGEEAVSLYLMPAPYKFARHMLEAVRDAVREDATRQ